MANNTRKRGLGSDKMSESEKMRIHKAGGKASGVSRSANRSSPESRTNESHH